MRFLIIFIFLISDVLANEIPNIKNIVVNKEFKTYDNITFLDSNKKTIKLNDYRGKLVILNFWATWCAPCKKEMPHLDTLQSINKLENLKIFPINVGKEKIEKAEKFFLELKIKNLDIYFDDTEKLANSFSLRGIPTSVIINKNGEEFARIMGAIDFTDKKFVEWLR